LALTKLPFTLTFFAAEVKAHKAFILAIHHPDKLTLHQAKIPNPSWHILSNWWISSQPC